MQSGVIVVDLIMGLIFIGGLLSIIRNSRKKGRCAAQTYARVVDFTVSDDYDSDGQKEGTSYHPIIEFSYGSGYDQQGQLINYVVRKPAGYSVSSKRKVKLGSNVKVFYNPARPDEFYVKEHSSTGGFLLMFFSALTAIVVTIGSMQ